VNRPLKPTVTFLVAWHRCPATGTKLYCLVTEAHECEQLAQGRYLTAKRPGVELTTSRFASHVRIITTLLRKLCHNNKHFSELAPNHGGHRYDMRKLRHCHAVYRPAVDRGSKQRLFILYSL